MKVFLKYNQLHKINYINIKHKYIFKKNLLINFNKFYLRKILYNLLMISFNYSNSNKIFKFNFINFNKFFFYLNLSYIK